MYLVSTFLAEHSRFHVATYSQYLKCAGYAQIGNHARWHFLQLGGHGLH